MDAARFDAIVRALATPGSRRRALGALLAAVAVALAPAGLEVTKGKKGKHRKNRKRTNERAHDVGISAKKGKKKKGKKKNKRPKPQPKPTPTPSDCATGHTECDGQCVNPKTNPQHCGNCGVRCAAISANMECVAGACLCQPDFAFCGDPGAPSGGSCVTLGTLEHCQRCGDACTGDPCENVTCDPERGCQRIPKQDDESCGNNRFCKAGACIDYDFPGTLKLPWCSGEKEPRRVTQDWEGHDSVGISLDFGRPPDQNGIPGPEVKGTLVLAPVGGTVKRDPYPGSSLGKHVLIDAGNGWGIILAHLDDFDANLGTTVSTGDVIGTLGGSGAIGSNDFVPHIHIDLVIADGVRWEKPDIAKLDRLYGQPRDAFDCPEGSDCRDDQAFFSTQRECGAGPCAGVDCSGLPHVEEASCSDGQCVIARCKPGFADCDGDPTTGCELGSMSAGTTSFRSATLVTTDGTPAYVNLQNCAVTDGLTCDRESETGYANLYFQNFGNLADFGIPRGATVTRVHVRVTGKSSHGYYVGLFRGSSLCYFPSDWWTVFGTSEIRTFTFSGPIGNSSVPRTVSSFCLNDQTIDASAFFLRVNRSSGQPWNAFIDNLEIAFDYDPPSSPICP